MEQTNYMKYRGKCKEFSELACAENPNLTMVRGHYYCPIWNRNEQHWWCVDQDGTIHDPTKQQFPSNGLGEYVPFDGHVTCDNCSKQILEDEARFEGRYAFCSTACVMRFVGL